MRARARVCVCGAELVLKLSENFPANVNHVPGLVMFGAATFLSGARLFCVSPPLRNVSLSGQFNVHARPQPSAEMTTAAIFDD